jgi:hypothetical protein
LAENAAELRKTKLVGALIWEITVNFTIREAITGDSGLCERVERMSIWNCLEGAVRGGSSREISEN